MRIVIVDDHILFREGLISLFRSQADIEVVGQAGTVKEAVETVTSLKPDIVLLDYSLPDGTGADAAGAILLRYPECKIVFLTVHDSDEQLFDSIRSGAKGYILKSIPFPRLASTIRALAAGDEAVLSPAHTARLMNEFARGPVRETGSVSTVERLSPREIEILGEVAKGLTNHEISQRLFLSENTVKHHIHNILEKLDLQTRQEAARFAVKSGLVRVSAPAGTASQVYR